MRTATRQVIGVRGSDPISQAGIESQLRTRPRLAVSANEADPIDAMVLTISADDAGLSHLRRLNRTTDAPVVVVVDDVDDAGVLRLIEEGASAVLRRTEATPEMLEEVVEKACRGEATLPGDLLGGLLRQVKRLQHNVLDPRGLNLSGLSTRELSVLTMVADGMNTRDIATELCYSERTIKNILQDIMRRFGLKNRSHAVAFAVREGLI